MTRSVTAPPSPDVLPVLSGLLRDAALLAERGTAKSTDIDTAMRLGAGHPADPFEVLAALPLEQLAQLGVHLPGDEDAAVTVPAAPAAWTGPVGVVGTGHMASGITEAVARSGRPVRVLARSSASGDRLREKLTASLDRAVSRGKLDEAGRDDVLARVSVTTEPAGLAGTDVVIEAIAEDLDV